MSMSSLKIRGGEIFLVALPIRRPHYWVGHSARLGEGYLVLRLELESGIVGWGEAQVIGTWGGDHGTRYGETPKTTATAILKGGVRFTASDPFTSRSPPSNGRSRDLLRGGTMFLPKSHLWK